MHRHLTPAGHAATSGDGVCHIRTATQVALPGPGLTGVLEPSFAWHVPPGAHAHTPAPAALVSQRTLVELPPPRA
jgi:hypothetical protein